MRIFLLPSTLCLIMGYLSSQTTLGFWWGIKAGVVQCLILYVVSLTATKK